MLLGACLVLAVVFAIPLFVEGVTIQSVYVSVPLVVAVLVVPVSSYVTTQSDIHVGFEYDSRNGNLIAHVTNQGPTPFTFNRVALTPYKKVRWPRSEVGKVPQEGLCDPDIQWRGGGEGLHDLDCGGGCVIERGKPVDVIVRPSGLDKAGVSGMANYSLCLYWYGASERALSGRLPSP